MREWTRKRELRRVGAAVAQSYSRRTATVFLADVGHDRIPPSENHQLFLLVVLDISRAGRTLRCRLRLSLQSLTQSVLPF